jgi:polyisoprenoid-binding protein YceI
MKKHITTLLIAAGLTTLAAAETLTFDFKDAKGVNNAVFKLDAPLEAISGSANGVSGTVKFDPANPAATTGKIVVAADSLHVPNSMMRTMPGHGGRPSTRRSASRRSRSRM